MGPTCVPGFSTHLSKPVEERLGEPLSAPALSEGVLAAEDLGLVLLHLEAQSQLGNVDLRPVVEAGVQTLQHRLGGQVQLVDPGVRGAAGQLNQEL